MINLEQKQKHWLEPMEKWIKDAGNMEKLHWIATFLLKVVAKEIFGSNLLLQKRVRASAPNSFEKAGECGRAFGTPTIWLLKTF